MDPTARMRVELDDGTVVHVGPDAERVRPGLLGQPLRTGEEELLALRVEPDAPPELREWVASQLRRIREGDGGRMGAVGRARVRAPRDGGVGYREAAGRRVEDEGSPWVLLSRRPTMLSCRVLTTHARSRWPWAVVARLARELSRALEGEPQARVDPFTVGLDARGAWLLDPALDTLLRGPAPGEGSAHEPAWVGYLAPERLRRAEPSAASGGAGRHGLGVLLYELLTGAPLYTRETMLETLVALRRGTPPPLAPAVPGIPLDLAACVHSLLDHDPRRRPDPALVEQTLAPHAAEDLAWCAPLVAQHGRALDHLRVTLRLPA